MTNPLPKPGQGTLYGKQQLPRDIARWCYDAGWNDAEQLHVAVCIVLAESQGYDHAIHVNLDGTQDRGIWQLNSIHKSITDEIAYDPEKATDAAFKLYVARNGFEDWAAYTSGVFLHDSYLGRATVGVGNFLAQRMLAIPVPGDYEHKLTTPVADFHFRVSQQLSHVEKAHKLLGWQAINRGTVVSVQQELAKAHTAAHNTLPEV